MAFIVCDDWGQYTYCVCNTRVDAEEALLSIAENRQYELVMSNIINGGASFSQVINLFPLNECVGYLIIAEVSSYGG